MDNFEQSYKDMPKDELDQPDTTYIWLAILFGVIMLFLVSAYLIIKG